MNTPIIHSIAYFLVLLLIASPAISAELYRWVDERGTVNITDYPPVKAAKVLGKDTYRDPTPGETRKNQEQEKFDQTQSDIERDRFLRNQAALRVQEDEELRRAEDNLDQAQKDLELYRNGARFGFQEQWTVYHYEQKKQDAERELEANIHRVTTPENQ